MVETINFAPFRAKIQQNLTSGVALPNGVEEHYQMGTKCKMGTKTKIIRFKFPKSIHKSKPNNFRWWKTKQTHMQSTSSSLSAQRRFVFALVLEKKLMSGDGGVTVN